MDALKMSMNYRWSIRFLAVVGIVITMIFLKPWSNGGIFLTLFVAAWLLSPYLILLYLNEYRFGIFNRPRAYILFVVGILLIGIGCWVDITYFHRDPLALIVMFMVTPIQSASVFAAWSWCKL
jgi:uncharacterized membrane protein YczE